MRALLGLFSVGVPFGARGRNQPGERKKGYPPSCYGENVSGDQEEAQQCPPYSAPPLGAMEVSRPPEGAPANSQSSNRDYPDPSRKGATSGKRSGYEECDACGSSLGFAPHPQGMAQEGTLRGLKSAFKLFETLRRARLVGFMWIGATRL